MRTPKNWQKPLIVAGVSPPVGPYSVLALGERRIPRSVALGLRPVGLELGRLEGGQGPLLFRSRTNVRWKDEEQETVLVWQWIDPDQKGRKPERKPDDGKILREFIDLAEADPAQILAFAQRYGPLFLCRHGRPASHDAGPPHAMTRPSMQFYMGREYGRDLFQGSLQSGEGSRQATCSPTGCESLSVWYAWANCARAIWEIAGRVRAGKKGRPFDWFLICSQRRVLLEVVNAVAGADPEVPAVGPREAAHLFARSAPAAQLRMLVVAVRDMIHETGLRPHVELDADGRVQFTLEGVGVLSSVARDLVALLAGRSDSAGFAVCSNCGTAFTTARRRPVGRDHYCDEAECVRARSAASSRRNRARRNGPAAESPDR